MWTHPRTLVVCLAALISRLALLPMPLSAAPPPGSPPGVSAAVPLAAPFELKSGDRVAFVGDDLFERAQDNGYIETLLTSRFPDRDVKFRNFGWSGDTVRAEARSLFGPAAEGFKRLQAALDAWKPTVVFVSYGMSESFAGPGKLDEFVRDYETMLDMLAASGGTAGGTRVVMVSPIKHEDLGRPLPDPTAHNEVLRLYVEAEAKLAAKRGCVFVNLFDAQRAGELPTRHLTSDGIHLEPFGYFRAALAIGEALGLPVAPWSVELSADGRVVKAEGARVGEVKAAGQGLQFTVTPSALPLGPPLELPAVGSGNSIHLPVKEGKFLPTLRVTGLRAGLLYKLKDDSSPVPTCEAYADTLGRGTAIETPGEVQAEALRREIVAKTSDFFHRYRPANDTYIFGFRKHEQGQNAAEIPRFDPLVAAHEANIAKLRVPKPATFTLKE